MRIDLKKDKEVSEGSHREGRKDRGNREYGNIFYIKMPYCNLEIIHVVWYYSIIYFIAKQVINFKQTWSTYLKNYILCYTLI